MDGLVQLARRLIDVPSVVGSEGDVGRVVAEALADRGFNPAFQPVEGARRNVYAIHGAPTVVLCTHMDTVGPFIPSSEDSDYVRGRGSCDAKGIAAAMIEAGCRLREEGTDGFALLFVVGEESVSDGARRTEELGWTSRAVIVGEPTDNVLASGHKGFLSAELTATGRAAHSGYPALGVSAVDRLVDALVALRGVDWGRHPVLGAGSVNVGVVQGGTAANVVPSSARAVVGVRVVDSAAMAEQRLRVLLRAHPDVGLQVRGASDPVECSTIEGWEARPVSFGTDLPYLGHFGERFLLGPGSIHDAHTENERISKAQLARAVDLYVTLTRTLIEDRYGDSA